MHRTYSLILVLYPLGLFYASFYEKTYFSGSHCILFLADEKCLVYAAVAEWVNPNIQIFGFVQIEIIRRRLFHCDPRAQFLFYWIRKHCGKRRKCWFSTFSFSYDVFKRLFPQGSVSNGAGTCPGISLSATVAKESVSYLVTGQYKHKDKTELKVNEWMNEWMNGVLTLSQTTNFRMFQTERVCVRQFQIWWKRYQALQTGRKHCGKRRNCS